MSTLFQAVTTNDSVTANGASTHSTSSNACVDLFFLIGSSRGKDLSVPFLKAYGEDPELATRILLWSRDVREGAGERQLFRDLVLLIEDESIVRQVIYLIPELGRFDDLFVFMNTKYETDALDRLSYHLAMGNALAAKWIPRKGEVFNKLRKHVGFSKPQHLRSLLVSTSDTVEQKLCARQFDQVDYGKLPSVAAARYQKTFFRNDEVRYREYIESLQKGEAKINAGVVYPYDIIKSLVNGVVEVAEEQWKALPNWMTNTEHRILPVIDVSGSMENANIGSSKTTCKDAAIGLGLYIAERNVGIFQNEFISFSGKPNFHSLTGSLQNRYTITDCSGEDMNTNLLGVFKTMLTQAKNLSVPADQMPTMLIILSDMEFDQCQIMSAYRRNGGLDSDNVAAIKTEYDSAGYEVPTLVFWNLNGTPSNIPVKYNDLGVMMVSGFSPAIMKSILSCTTITPHGIMMETVFKERYNPRG